MSKEVADQGTSEPARQTRVLVYGTDKLGLSPPAGEHGTPSYVLVFKPFETTERFQDYDGVIFFQGIFERFTERGNGLRTWLEVDYDIAMLDQREKEVSLLLAGGGFACVLLHKPFVDDDRGTSFKRTDLAKRLLNWDSLYRRNLGGRYTEVHAVVNEFEKFFGLFGAAYTFFTCHNDALNVRGIAKFGPDLVGFSMEPRSLFIPVLVPRNDPDTIMEFFGLLVEAVLARLKRATTEAPAWVQSFSFPEEEPLRQRREELTEQIGKVEGRLAQLERFKLVLVHDSELLVEDVQLVLSEGFSLTARVDADYKADIKVFDAGGKPMMLVEVKGTNGGVKRDFVYQADTHRERAGVADDFPSLLIVNTNLRGTTVAGKDVEVATEQVQRARKVGVLILRTLDLLNIVVRLQAKQLTRDEVVRMFTVSTGWLKATPTGWELLPPK